MLIARLRVGHGGMEAIAPTRKIGISALFRRRRSCKNGRAVIRFEGSLYFSIGAVVSASRLYAGYGVRQFLREISRLSNVVLIHVQTRGSFVFVDRGGRFGGWTLLFDSVLFR